MNASRTLKLLAALTLTSVNPAVAQAHAGHMNMDHSPASMKSQMDAMLAPLRPLSGKAFDIRWTQLMIEHHQMAVEMARYELKHGRDPRVKAEANKVYSDQLAEIAQMQDWLRVWQGKAHQLRPMPMTATGSVDRWFLEGMIPHHQGGVDMSALALTRTRNARLRAMSEHIKAHQTAEIAIYRTLLKTVK